MTHTQAEPADTILQAIQDQDKGIYDNRRGIADVNIATNKYGAKVILGKVSCGTLEKNLLEERTDCNSTLYTYHEATDHQGIVIDLGATKRFNNIRVLPYTAGRWNYIYTAEVSCNQKEWNNVVAADTRNNNEKWQDHRFDTVRARYIRLKGNDAQFTNCSLNLISVTTSLKQDVS